MTENHEFIAQISKFKAITGYQTKLVQSVGIRKTYSFASRVKKHAECYIIQKKQRVWSHTLSVETQKLKRINNWLLI